MNKNTFRLVFNKKVGMLVPVAECASAQGKAGAGEASVGQGAASPAAPPAAWVSNHYSRQRLAATVALVANFWGATWGSMAWAQALPQGGAVTSGQGAVSASGNHMTIQQSTQVLGMNWQSFNIGAGNTVQFVQPNSQSVAVNQVLGNSRSEIFGNLQANGKVFLLNPNGVLFGSTAQVDVGALVASTARSINQDANGQWVLGQIGPGSVINQGHIRAADGGFVVLAGNQARNEGTIQANGGGVALAVGESVSIDISQGRQLKVKVDGALLNALAENQGLILAEGGAVYLTAAGREALLSTVVNNGGVIQANSIVEREGRILLLGTGGDTINSGTLDASGQVAGAKGGAVVMGGNRVALVGNGTSKAIIDVSGVAGGGRAIIGGDLLGKATDIASIGLADYAVVGSNAEIRIGSAQGDGGFVETSGKSLTVLGTVKGQSAGKNGEWLIDPNDVTISTADTANMSASTPFAPSGTGAGVVKNTAISGALSAGTSVTITTAGSGTAQGNITQLAGAHIVKSGSGDASLTLIANRSIALNGNITSTAGTLDVDLQAKETNPAGRGVVTITGAAIDVNGGNFSASSNATGNGINIVNSQLRNISGGNINAVGVTCSTGTVVINNTTINQTGAGTLNITGTGAGTARGVSFITGSTVTQTGGGTLNIIGNTSHGIGAVAFDLGTTLAQEGSGTINVNGTMTLVSGTPSVVSNTAVVMGGNVSQSGAGLISINGTANATFTNTTTGAVTRNGRGVVVTGNLTQSGTGVINITANANREATSFSGTSTNKVNINQSGAGAININGTTFNSSLAPVTFNANTSINQTGAGAINISATDMAASAIQIFAAISQHGSGSIDINAQGRPGINNYGLTFNGNLLQAGNGSVNLTANTGHGAIAIGGTSNITQQGNGTITLNGTSRIFVGVGFGSTTKLVQEGNGTIVIEGKSISSRSVDLAGNITQTATADGAVLNITGTGTGGNPGASVAVRANGLILAQLANATLNIHGTAGPGDAFDLNTTTISQTSNGVLNLTGASGNGVSMNLNRVNITQTGAGTLVLSGATAADGDGDGLKFNSGVISQSGTGNLSLTGSSGNGAGMTFVDGVLRQSGGGTLNVTGTSVTGNGIAMTGATRIGTSQSNATINTTTAGVSTVSTVNTTVVTAVNTTFTDLVDVTTTVVTNDVAATTTVAGTTDGSLRINQSSASGTINIKGSSGSATGLLIDAAFINQSAAATLTINGTSTTGAGLAIGSGVLGTANATSTNVVTSSLSNPLATNTTVNTSNSSTVASGADNVVTTSNITSLVTRLDATGAVTTEINTTTNGKTDTYLAPRMVFNSSVAGSTILLSGSSNGSAGVLVQGDAAFSLADGSTLRLDGVTNAANAGPGVLVSGRTVNSSSAVTTNTSMREGVNKAEGTSSSNTSLVIPVTLKIAGTSTAGVVINGTSAGTGPGVLLGNEVKLDATGLGSINITGKSAAGQGVLMGGPVLTSVTTTSSNSTTVGAFTNNAGVRFNQTGEFNTNSSSTTVLGSSAFNVTLAGNVNVSGSTTTGANAVQVGGAFGSEVMYVPANTSVPKTLLIQTAQAGGGSLDTNTTVDSTINRTHEITASAATGNLTIVGPVAINATGNLSVAPGTNTTVTGDATLTSTATATLGGNLTSSGGNVTIAAANDVVAPGNITAAGNLSIASTNGNVNTSGGSLNATNGTVAIAAPNGSASLGNVTATNLNVAAAGNITSTAAVVVSGNSTLNTTTGAVALTGNNDMKGLTTIITPSGSGVVNGASNVVYSLSPSGQQLLANNGLSAGGFLNGLFSGSDNFDRIEVAYPAGLTGALASNARPVLLKKLNDGLNKPKGLLDEEEAAAGSKPAAR